MPLKLNVEYQSQMNHNSQSQHTENHEDSMRTQKQNDADEDRPFLENVRVG